MLDLNSIPLNGYYTVQRGDTLSGIAQYFWGDANLWPAIHRANTDTIRDPNRIQVGWQLRIPQDPYPLLRRSGGGGGGGGGGGVDVEEGEEEAWTGDEEAAEETHDEDTQETYDEEPTDEEAYDEESTDEEVEEVPRGKITLGGGGTSLLKGARGGLRKGARARRKPAGAIAAGELEIFEDEGGAYALYNVCAGDTLESIAAYCYGDESLWEAIIEANPQLVEGNDLEEGMDLRIPVIEALRRAICPA
jgi:LysM repeat protein/phage tail protein X